MKIIKKVKQETVFSHWKKYDSSNNEMLRREMMTHNIKWELRKIEENDIANIRIISAADWYLDHGLALDKNLIDFSLKTVHKNYLKRLPLDDERCLQILARKVSIERTKPKTLIFVTHNNKDFVCYEGNRRLVALYDLKRLNGLEVYVGYSPSIYETPEQLANYALTKEPLNEYCTNLMTNGIYKYIWYNFISNTFGEAYNRKEDWNAFLDLHEPQKLGWTLIQYKDIYYTNALLKNR